MPRPTTVTRKQIENLVKRINQMENAHPTQTADEIVARLSALFPENIELARIPKLRCTVLSLMG